MATITEVSAELMVGTINLQTESSDDTTRAMTAEMDSIVFQGTDSAPEPSGNINQSDIGNTGAGDALTNYAKLLITLTEIKTQKASPPTAMVMHPSDYRTWRD